MELSNSATPEEVITYVEELVGREYGESVYVSFLMDEENPTGSNRLITRQVCGYVAYLLGVGFTDFPGCSEKDSGLPKKITPETIQEFKRRTASYLLPKISIVPGELETTTKAA